MQFSLIVTDEITLRLPTLDDAPVLFDLFVQNREHLSEWQDWPLKIKTLEDCEAFIQRHQEEYKASIGLATLIIYNEQIVGMCDLSKIVMLLRKAEIGYWIAKGIEGQGIVRQATLGLMEYAFETMNINRLALKYKRASETHENIRSRRVAERLGFVREGVLRQDGMTKGVMMDMVMYSMLAEEWHANYPSDDDS